MTFNLSIRLRHGLYQLYEFTHREFFYFLCFKFLNARFYFNICLIASSLLKLKIHRVALNDRSVVPPFVTINPLVPASPIIVDSCEIQSFWRRKIRDGYWPNRKLCLDWHLTTAPNLSKLRPFSICSMSCTQYLDLHLVVRSRLGTIQFFSYVIKT